MAGRGKRSAGQAAAALAAAAVVVVAAWLRLAGGLVHPLWLDEAYSAYAAAHGWTFLWTVVPRYETHPPFYYSLLHLWTLLFGDSLGALRGLGLAASLATLPVMALAGREIARIVRPGQARPVAVPLAALLLIALDPFPMAMGQQVRPYALMILVYAVACLALLRIARHGAVGAGLPRRPLALYFAALALMLWLHNMGPLYAVGMTLALAAVVLRRGLARRDWTVLALGHAAVALAYLPGFLILVDQAPTWVSSTWLRFTTHALQWRLAAMVLVATGIAVGAAALLLLLAIVALGRGDAGRRAAAALILLAAVPVALSILLSMYVAPVFIPRTMAAAAVPLLLLLAGGVGARGAARLAGWAGIAVLAWQMIAVDRRITPGRPVENWYAAAEWMRPRFRAGDLVLSYPNEAALPFGYAARDRGLAVAVRPIPSAVPAIGIPGGWYPTGSRGVVSLPRASLAVIARSAEVARAPTVWLLRSGAATYDSGDIFLRELRRGRVQVGRFRSGPIDIIGLRRTDAALSARRGARAGAGAAR